MSPLLLVILVIALGAFVVWATSYGERKEKAERQEYQELLAIAAQEFGGEFRAHGFRKRDDRSPDGRRRDVRFLKRLPFLDEWEDLDASYIENLIAVRYPDLDVYAFELVTPIPNKPEHRRTIVAARLTSRLPSVQIWPRGSRIAGTAHALDLPIMHLEWEAFNHLYQVRSPRPREAHALLVPAFLEFLMDASPNHWAIGGCFLYALPYGTNPLKAPPTLAEAVAAVRNRIETIRGVVSLIPGYILEEGQTGHRWASLFD